MTKKSEITRRDLLIQLPAGAAMLSAVSFLGIAQQRDVALGGKQEELSGSPKELLSSTFTREVLSRSLISLPAWNPYPRIDDRDVWKRIPPHIGGALVRRAEAGLGGEWVPLPASLFLQFQRNGNRTNFEDLYFERRQILTDLVLGECIEGKGRFLDEIVNGVWFTCEETSWSVPAHLKPQKVGLGLPDCTDPIVDLFAAETVSAVALVHYVLRSRLDHVSPLIARLIELEAKRRILDPAFVRDDFSWMWGGSDGKGHLNNWNPWINSNWLTANLLLEQDPARRIAATLRICKSPDQFLSEYASDGACDEGPSFWGVTAPPYLVCCNLLTSAAGGAASVLGKPFIRKMMHYILDVHVADHYYFDYGDAHADRGGHPPETAYRMGIATGDKALVEFGAFYASVDEIRNGKNSALEGRLGRANPDILSAEKTRGAEKVDALARDSWYQALCLMTAREKAGSTDGFYLAAMAAPNLRTHGHNDSGGFIVFHNGAPVFIDVGVEAYTSKSFGFDRYNIWTMQSAFHNLPTVDGVMQAATDPRYRAAFVNYTNDDSMAVLSLDLAPAYPDEAGLVKTHFQSEALTRAVEARPWLLHSCGQATGRHVAPGRTWGTMPERLLSLRLFTIDYGNTASPFPVGCSDPGGR